MSANLSDERLVRIVATAMLYAENPDILEVTIAHILGVAPSSTTADLNTAKALGIAKEVRHFVKSNIPRNVKRLVKAATELINCGQLHRALCIQLDILGQDFVQEVHITKAPKYDVSAESSLVEQAWDNATLLVATRAGRWFKANLKKMSHVGVLWGSTVRRFVDVVRDLDMRRPPGGITFVPLSGDTPTKHTDRSPSASTLATELAIILGQKAKRRPVSLVGIPATISGAVSPSAVAEIAGVYQGQEAYQSIFSGDQALIHKIDTILTSAGGQNRHFQADPILDFWLSVDERQRWATSVSGDLGGVVFPPLGEDSNDFVATVSGRWLGLTMDMLRSCAERARQENHKGHGVIVVARGAEKADVILEAIRRRCVNVLFVDDDLAAALLKKLKERTWVVV